MSKQHLAPPPEQECPDPKRHMVARQQECEHGGCVHSGQPGVTWSQVMAAPDPGAFIRPRLPLP